MTVDRLKSIFCEVFRLKSDEIEDSLSLGQIHQWDSLGHMNLINAIENNYGFEFTFEEIVAMVSFKDACRIVDLKLNGSVSP